MTDEQLKQIRERADAATPGPWWDADNERHWQLFGGGIVNLLDGSAKRVHGPQLIKAPKMGTPYAEYWPTPADARFIVAAREDIPALLAEIDRLRRIEDAAIGVMAQTAEGPMDGVECALYEALEGK